MSSALPGSQIYSDSPAGAAQSSDSTGLPVPLTALVGRDGEVALAESLLRRDDIRLLTLTGPGGVGKTRLAIAVARLLATDFVDGVVFVPLAGITVSDRASHAVAVALGIGEGGEHSLRQSVLARLATTRMLIVLDNYEHLLAAASLVTDILLAAPLVKILVTSRTLLRVSGEQAFPVPPLRLPVQTDAASLTEILASPAVQVFAMRAASIAPSFAITESNGPLVAEICRRLDGLPLALELAATRVNFLPLAALRDQLEGRLPLLTSGPRNAPRRHQTMRNAISWSYDLLTNNEQTVFRRLAVFVGGFTLEAAEIIGGLTTRAGQGSPAGIPGVLVSYEDGADQGPPSHALGRSVLEIVGSLVDSSLVRQDGSRSSGPRFTLLETVRVYALEQLEASGELPAVRRAHADWCLDILTRSGNGAAGMQADLSWLPVVEVEYGNILAALDWLRTVHDATGALRLAQAVRPLWEVRGNHDEAIAQLEDGLDRDNHQNLIPADLRMKSLVGLGRHYQRQGRRDEALERFEAALALATLLGDQDWMAATLYALGATETNRLRFDQATPYLEQALVLYEESNDPLGICGCHYFRGIGAYAQGNMPEAIASIEAALDVRRANGPIFNLSVLLNALACLYAEQGSNDQAFNTLTESYQAWQATDGTNREILAEWLMAAALFQYGNNRPREAVRLGGASEAFTAIVGMPLVVPPSGPLARFLSDLRVLLGTEVFATEWAVGSRLSMEDAVALVLNAPSVGERSTTPPLSPREVEVLTRIVDGKTDQGIANELFVSVRTIEWHVARIRAKLGAGTRAEAARLAVARRLVPARP